MENTHKNNYPFRKHIRLDSHLYVEPGAICSITITVQKRRAIFSDPIIARPAVDVLQAHAAKTGVLVYGYCVMPDHVHLVLEPSEKRDIVSFVGQYKNLAQRTAWKLGVKGSFWQKSFWDHFLRSEEQVESVVEYIVNNPVRKGMVDHWREYSFSGSLIFEL